MEASAQNTNAPVSPSPQSKAHFRSISISLAVAFSCLVAVVLLVNSGLNMFFNFQKEQNIISSLQISIAEKAADTVHGFFDKIFDSLNQADDFNDLSVIPDRRELVLNKLLGRNESLRQLLLIDKEGKELAKVSDISNSNPIHLTDKDIKILLSVVKEKKHYISDVSFDQITQEPLITLAVPAKNAFGDVKGALIAEVNLKFIWDLVGNVKVGKKGAAYVVDRQGNLLAFEDTSRVLKRENLNNLKEVNEFMTREEEGAKNAIEIAPGIAGTKTISSHALLKFPDWAVIVELPVDEAYEPFIAEVGLAFLMMVASILLSVVVVIYLSKRLTQPIIKLRDSAEKIGEGNLKTSINVDSRNEIGDLARAFSEMVNKLRNFQFGLEQKVEEKTHELSEKVDELEKANNLMVGRELKMIELKEKLKECENNQGKK